MNQYQLLQQLNERNYMSKFNNQPSYNASGLSNKQLSEEEELMKKREAQRVYKEMLDHQNANRAAMKMYGNMTNVEKQINKEDLIAWKIYDNNQYSLIPGVSSQKKVFDRQQVGSKGYQSQSVDR